MNMPEAVAVLRAHNAWRRGGPGDMVDPKQVGQAMDLMIRHGERMLRRQRKAKKQ